MSGEASSPELLGGRAPPADGAAHGEGCSSTMDDLGAPSASSNAGAEDPDDSATLMASLAAAEQILKDSTPESSSGSPSMDSEERDMALLQQQMADEGRDGKSSASGSSCSMERRKATAARSRGRVLEERSSAAGSSSSRQLIQGLQASVEKDRASASSGTSDGRQEELWRLVQQQRKDLIAQEQEVEDLEAKHAAEVSKMMHRLHVAQERKDSMQDALERVQSNIRFSQELAMDLANDLKDELADVKDNRLSSDSKWCDLDDLIAARSAKYAEQMKRLEKSAESQFEINEEKNKERFLVDAAQKRIQEAQIRDLKRELEKTQSSISQVKGERDQLRDRAAVVAQNNSKVPLLQQEIAHLKFRLEEKLDRAGDRELVPHTQGFHEIMDEMKEAQRREVETKKAREDLKEQVKDITKEKEAAEGVLEHEDFDSDWQWMEVKNAYHSGHDMPGSGQAYTLDQARKHAQNMQAAGFTQDRFLHHPADTDGIFWFHSKIGEASKMPRDTGRPDGMQNLFFRSEALIPKVRMWFDGQKKSVAAAAGAPGLGAISEDGDNLSDHGSVGVSAGGNASSVGDIDEVADIHDFDDGLYGFNPVLAEARLAETAELERELQGQLAEERVQKDKAADELAAYVGAKENALTRLRERVEDSEVWRARAQQKVVDARTRADNNFRAKEEAVEEEKERLALKEEDGATKDRRVAELKQRISMLKNHFDEALPEWAELRSLIAMAKFGKQVADMRVVDFRASATAMENMHNDRVNRLNAAIAALREPGAVVPAQSGADPEEKRAPGDDPAAVERDLAAVRQEISDLTAALDSSAREHAEAKRALEAQLAAEAEALRAAHESDVKELQSTLGATVEALRLSLAEATSGS